MIKKEKTAGFNYLAVLCKENKNKIKKLVINLELRGNKSNFRKA